MNLFLLLAQETAGTSWDRLLRPDVLFFLVPISAIVGGILFAIVKAVIRHRERMAMIEHGINPNEKSR